MNDNIIIAVGTAFVITFLNVSAAILIIRKGVRIKDKRQFNKIVLGSMVARFFIVLAFFGLGLIVLELHEFYFPLSLIFFSFIFLMGEILYINFHSKFVNLQNNFSK